MKKGLRGVTELILVDRNESQSEKFVGACKNVNFGGIIDIYSPARDLQRKQNLVKSQYPVAFSSSSLLISNFLERSLHFHILLNVFHGQTSYLLYTHSEFFFRF